MRTQALPLPPRQTPLGDLLVKLARKFATQESRELDDLAIGPTQHRLLELVVAAPGICPAAVAERLAIDKAAASRAVNRLVRNGFVERRRGTRDRRFSELFPTRSGAIAVRVFSPDFASPEMRLVAGFSADELQQLRTFLVRLDANLDVTAKAFIRYVTRGPRRPGDSLKDD